MWLTEFDLRQVDDTYFMLLQDLVYYSEKYKLKITVPAGFVSDGPSVPRVPFLFFFFGHKGKRASVIHDWLYRNKLLSREICDEIFKEALLDSGKYKITAYGMFAGVRVGGWNSYRGYRLGCLDPRIMCLEDCLICENYFGSYLLTVIPYMEK